MKQNFLRILLCTAGLSSATLCFGSDDKGESFPLLPLHDTHRPGPNASLADLEADADHLAISQRARRDSDASRSLEAAARDELQSITLPMIGGRRTAEALTPSEKKAAALAVGTCAALVISMNVYFKVLENCLFEGYPQSALNISNLPSVRCEHDSSVQTAWQTFKAFWWITGGAAALTLGTMINRCRKANRAE